MRPAQVVGVLIAIAALSTANSPENSWSEAAEKELSTTPSYVAVEPRIASDTKLVEVSTRPLSRHGGRFTRKRCICPHTFKPVCVHKFLTLRNACFAKCNGYKKFRKGRCSKRSAKHRLRIKARALRAKRRIHAKKIAKFKRWARLRAMKHMVFKYCHHRSKVFKYTRLKTPKGKRAAKFHLHRMARAGALLRKHFKVHRPRCPASIPAPRKHRRSHRRRASRRRSKWSYRRRRSVKAKWTRRGVYLRYARRRRRGGRHHGRVRGITRYAQRRRRSAHRRRRAPKWGYKKHSSRRRRRVHVGRRRRQWWNTQRRRWTPVWSKHFKHQAKKWARKFKHAGRKVRKWSKKFRL